MNIKPISFLIIILGFFGHIIASEQKKNHKTFQYQAQFYDFPKETNEFHPSLASWKEGLKKITKEFHNPPKKSCRLIFNDNHPDDDRFSCALLVCAYSNDSTDLEWAVKTELLKYKMHHN